MLRRGTLYFVLSFLCIILTIEICARYFGETGEVERELQFITKDSSLGWSNRPSTTGIFASRRNGFSAKVTFDPQGLRTNGSSALADGFNILLIGDSVLVGMEVNDDQTFASLLQDTLRRHGFKANVINGGVRGYGTDQTYLRLRELIPQLRPDLVLFIASDYSVMQLTVLKNWYRYFGKPAFALDHGELQLLNSPVEEMNQEDYAYLAYDDDGCHVLRGQAKLSGVASWLRRHSFLFSFLDQIYYGHFYNKAINPPESLRPWGNKTFKKIISKMSQQAPHFLMTAFTTQKGGFVQGYDLIQSMAGEVHVPFLDIRPYFKNDGQYVYLPDGHYNPAGHAQVAAALYELLLGSLPRQ